MRAIHRGIVVAVLGTAVLLAGSLGAAATPVAVKTTGGDVIQGTLSGLAAVLRLVEPTPAVGPAAQFDMPLAAIQQVWVDFPRVVIETVSHVIIGPFSSFSGIAQTLRVDQLGGFRDIPFAAIRQIAFGDVGFHELPREWLGQGWLDQRGRVIQKTVQEVAAAAAVLQAASATTTSPSASSTGTAWNEALAGTSTLPSETVVWNGAVPAEPAPSTSSGELPWWVLLVGVAVLFGVFLLVPTGGGS